MLSLLVNNVPPVYTAGVLY